MSMNTVSAKSFVSELMKISTGIVWVNPYMALSKEPDDNRVAVESYITARKGELNFNSVFQFHEDVLRPFFPNPEDLMHAMMDKRIIPANLRQMIVDSESRYLIDNWENRDGEKNDYYRELYGLPPMETPESEFVYNTKYNDIDQTTPVHLLDYTDRLRLENRGYFKELLATDTHKDKKYLEHLGVKRVYPYIARQAEYFEIVYCPNSDFTYLRNDFLDVYEQARRMVMRVYYNNAYRNKSPIYEGFLGMLILFIAQQRMCEKYLEADISRNFYDIESLRVVYDAYGVPFYPSIPLKYHEQIVKHINELISYKGSTQVFYDVFGLFDFGQMDVFEYYLVKERKTNSLGNPVFYHPDGTPLSDQEKYNLRFAKVSWRENKFVQVTNPELRTSYESLTEPDPYWVEDAALKEKLYGEDWNYFQSKYMGVQIMFDLSKLLFETCYFLRMLADNRSTMEAMTVYYSMTAQDIPIFDMVIYAFALLCKNAGYQGTIPADPASIGRIYGFNFKDYNELLKLATANANDFVLEFKSKLLGFVADNEMLSADPTVKYLIQQITNGAFHYQNKDFPFGEWGKVPPPRLLHDFIPTYNTVETLRKYLKETMAILRADPSITEFELKQLYRELVTKDNMTFMVVSPRSIGQDLKYETFLLKHVDFDEEDVKNLREALIDSYEGLFRYLVLLIDARESLTFDPHIVDLIVNMNIDVVDDIERVYLNMKELDEYLTYRIRTCSKREEYEALLNIRKILMTTKLVNETFQFKDGSFAGTYEQLLSEINPELYKRLVDEFIDHNTEEQYVLQTLMKLCDDLTLLEAVNTDNIKRLVEYMFKILRFLKSAKVDLVDFHIIYMITSRSMNYIKMISEIWAQEVEGFLPKDIWHLYMKLHIAHVVQYLECRFQLGEKNHGMKIKQQFRDYIDELFDMCWHTVEMFGLDKFEYLADWLHREAIIMKPQTIMTLHDGINDNDAPRFVDYFVDDAIYLYDEIDQEVIVLPRGKMQDFLTYADQGIQEILANILSELTIQDKMQHWHVRQILAYAARFTLATNKLGQKILQKDSMGFIKFVDDWWYTVEQQFRSSFGLKLFHKATDATQQLESEFGLYDEPDTEVVKQERNAFWLKDDWWYLVEQRFDNQIGLRIYRKASDLEQRFDSQLTLTDKDEIRTVFDQESRFWIEDDWWYRVDQQINSDMLFEMYYRASHVDQLIRGNDKPWYDGIRIAVKDDLGSSSFKLVDPLYPRMAFWHEDPLFYRDYVLSTEVTPHHIYDGPVLVDSLIKVSETLADDAG